MAKPTQRKDCACPCHESGVAMMHVMPCCRANEPEGQITLPEAARDLIRAMHDDQRTVGYRLDLWNIMQSCLDATAHPVADAGGVTESDRIATADLLDEISSLLDHVGIGQVADLIRDGEYDEHEAVSYFTSHRLQSVAAATAAKDAEIAELAQAVRCIMARCEALEDEAYNGIANDRDKTHASGFWCGQKSTAKSLRAHLHDMTRAASQKGGE